MYSPKSCPLGENAFVQGHTDGVHLTDWTIEMCLEISMRPEGFAYMARSAVFCMELDGLKIVYIIWKKSILDAVLERKKRWKATGVEEHITDCSGLLVHFERVTSEDDTFGNNARGVGVQESTHGYKLWS